MVVVRNRIDVFNSATINIVRIIMHIAFTLCSALF